MASPIHGRRAAHLESRSERLANDRTVKDRTARTSRRRLEGARVIVWIWDAAGPATDACGVAGTAEAARAAAGSLLTAGRAHVACVQQAAVVLGTALSYDYCPTGRTWIACIEAGHLAWSPGPVSA